MDDPEAIRQLKYRYVRTLDTKQGDDFAACFVPEATADYAGLAFPDRAALVDYMRSNLGPAIATITTSTIPRSRSTVTPRPAGGTSTTW